MKFQYRLMHINVWPTLSVKDLILNYVMIALKRGGHGKKIYLILEINNVSSHNKTIRTIFEAWLMDH